MLLGGGGLGGCRVFISFLGDVKYRQLTKCEIVG